jgi:hypothetical protein
MKSLIFFLFSITIFAQYPYPDTLFLTDGRLYPCLITDIDDSRVGMIYSNNRNETVVIEGIKKISLEELGTIYSVGNGFIKDIEVINSYTDKRFKEIKKEQMIKEEQERLAEYLKNDQTEMPNSQMSNFIRVQEEENYKKWSFGVLYIPYFSGTIYRVTRSSDPYYYPGTYGYGNNETNMEAQFSYGITAQVRFTFDVGYTSTYSEIRYEEHPRYPGSSSDYGYLTTNGLKLLDINLGLKYYFLDFFVDKVSVYAIAGIGKQFAFAEDKYENLYPQFPVPLAEDNMEEYIEELNSPWHFNLGFGAEYFFSESLSLISNIRFIYSGVSGEYNYRIIQQEQSNTRVEKYTNSEFITRVGLGLNFYF